VRIPAITADYGYDYDYETNESTPVIKLKYEGYEILQIPAVGQPSYCYDRKGEEDRIVADSLSAWLEKVARAVE
jgi:hypothetical protein